MACSHSGVALVVQEHRLLAASVASTWLEASPMSLRSCESLAMMVGCRIDVLVLLVEVVIVVPVSLGAMVDWVELLCAH